MSMRIYMQVTTDKYQLPVAVASTPLELAKLVGTSVNTIKSCISKGSKKYIRVDVEDDDNED